MTRVKTAMKWRLTLTATALAMLTFLVRCATWPCAVEVFGYSSCDRRITPADIEVVTIPGTPLTPEEHRAMARAYEEKARAYRAAKAKYHDNAYADEQRVPVIPKNANDDPRIKKIRENRDDLIEQAERLARASEHLALFHSMRASEVSSGTGH